MHLTERWFGPDDPVQLKHLRQIPRLEGIVSGLYDLQAGEAWPEDRIARLRESVEAQGLKLSAIESIPVHDAIKLGTAERDGYLDAYRRSIAAVARAGTQVVAYNWMPIVDWMRTRVSVPLPDGSTGLGYDEADLRGIDGVEAVRRLPGWTLRSPQELRSLVDAYARLGSEGLWETLAYFLDAMLPAAEACGVRLALHPDDPPWPVLGLPRIITDAAALQRVASLSPNRANGFTFCSGSLGANPANDLPAMIRQLGNRIHFAHVRNILRRGPRSFVECAHATGSLNLLEVMRALAEVGFSGPLRADHGRRIWGERRNGPGYGLYDRALGLSYLSGLWEGITRRGTQFYEPLKADPNYIHAVGAQPRAGAVS